MAEWNLRADPFVPDGPSPSGAPLSGFLSPLSAAVAARFAAAWASGAAAPILAPFSQSAATLQALAEVGRVVASDPNPLTAAIQELLLHPPAAAQVDQVLRQLGNVTVRGRLLDQYLQQLFHTPCPGCRQTLVAEAFVWEREE
ncbi:MAG: hypothetical protein GX605_13380, partial [Chloroflexi bacterium]|nr:hypothetical protein [Chloroflexota bacterium]